MGSLTSWFLVVIGLFLLVVIARGKGGRLLEALR